MKKLLTLLATFAVAFSLTMPAFAKRAKKSTDTAGEQGKAHKKHAKKKGEKKGKKEGQAGATN